MIPQMTDENSVWFITDDEDDGCSLKAGSLQSGLDGQRVG